MEAEGVIGAAQVETKIGGAVDIQVVDYVGKDVKLSHLPGLDLDSDAIKILQALRDVRPDLIKKGHYSLCWVDEEGHKFVLKTRETLRSLNVPNAGILYYVDVNRINVGRDYWAPPDDVRTLHFRSSKAYVKDHLGNKWDLNHKDRTKLYTLYTRTQHLILQRVRSSSQDDRKWDHRRQIEHLKTTVKDVKQLTWVVREGHLRLIDDVANELGDPDRVHMKAHPIIITLLKREAQAREVAASEGKKPAFKNPLRELVEWQYHNPTLYLLEKKGDLPDEDDENGHSTTTRLSAFQLKGKRRVDSDWDEDEDDDEMIMSHGKPHGNSSRRGSIRQRSAKRAKVGPHTRADRGGILHDGLTRPVHGNSNPSTATRVVTPPRQLNSFGNPLNTLVSAAGHYPGSMNMGMMGMQMKPSSGRTTSTPLYATTGHHPMQLPLSLASTFSPGLAAAQFMHQQMSLQQQLQQAQAQVQQQQPPLLEAVSPTSTVSSLSASSNNSYSSSTSGNSETSSNSPQSHPQAQPQSPPQQMQHLSLSQSLQMLMMDQAQAQAQAAYAYQQQQAQVQAQQQQQAQQLNLLALLSRGGMNSMNSMNMSMMAAQNPQAQLQLSLQAALLQAQAQAQAMLFSQSNQVYHSQSQKGRSLSPTSLSLGLNQSQAQSQDKSVGMELPQLKVHLATPQPQRMAMAIDSNNTIKSQPMITSDKLPAPSAGTGSPKPSTHDVMINSINQQQPEPMVA